MKKLLLMLIVALGLLTTNAFASKPECPKAEKSTVLGAKYISVADAKKAQANGALILDTRKSKEASEETIAGSVRALYKEKGGNKNRIAKFSSTGEKLTMKNIPKDKNAYLITFCNGPHCWRSYKASVILTKAGYKNVRWMRDGIPAWKKAGYPTK
jgi:rhodanese-related sulfurtransferase